MTAGTSLFEPNLKPLGDDTVAVPPLPLLTVSVFHDGSNGYV